MSEEVKQGEPLVEAVHLKKYFKIPKKGELHAVDDISFKIWPGETLGLVGESGCGKSTVGNVIMQLHRRTGGQFLYRSKDVFTASPAEKLELCQKMQIVFQDPFSSLNPRKTIEQILSEAYEIHHMGTAAEIHQKVLELCELVQIADNLLDHYPHELDGGMRQVTGIARALSLNADFIVCDEPVSSLDVSVQARIINLLMDLQQRLGLTYLFISHDLSVVRHISTRVAVMYLGQIVETADTAELFENTRHPYSIALLSAVPDIDMDRARKRIVLKGDVPSPMNPKPGCRFAPRCWMCREDCTKANPPLREIAPNHYVACFHAEESLELAQAMQTSKHN